VVGCGHRIALVRSFSATPTFLARSNERNSRAGMYHKFLPRRGFSNKFFPGNRRFCSQRLPATAFIVRTSGRLPRPRCRELWRKLRKTPKKVDFCEFSHRFSRVCSLSFRHLEIGQGGVASCRKQASTDAHREDAQLDRSHGRATPRF